MRTRDKIRVAKRARAWLALFDKEKKLMPPGCPDGAWGCWDRKSLGLTCRTIFPNEEITSCPCNVFGIENVRARVRNWLEQNDPLMNVQPDIKVK